MFDTKDIQRANISAFYLLELACIQMCKISALSRRKRTATSAELHDHFIYNTIVWGMFWAAIYKLFMLEG